MRNTIHEYTAAQLDAVLDYCFEALNNRNTLINAKQLHDAGILPEISVGEIEVIMRTISTKNEDILKYSSESKEGAIFLIGPFLREFKRRGLYATVFEKDNIEKNRKESERQAKIEANLATVDAAQSSKESAGASKTSASWSKLSGVFTAIAAIAAVVALLRPTGNHDIEDLEAKSQKHDSTITSLIVKIASLQDSLIKLRQKAVDTPRIVKSSK